jgi:hypothetical protein
MKNLIKLTLSLLMLSVSVSGQAQQDVEMADGMRSSGKIYVLVAIILVILIGLIGYLITVDRKVSRIEKKLSDHNLG